MILILKPLTTKLGILMTVFNELIGGLAMTSALAIGIYDKIGGDHRDHKFFLGWLIIFANVGLLYSLIIFTVVKLIYSSYQRFKEKKDHSKFSGYLRKMGGKNKNVIYPIENSLERT